jgi:hypothetical protein
MDHPIKSGKEPYATDLSGDFIGGIGVDSLEKARENSGGLPAQPTDAPVIDSTWGKVTHGN